jgi:hypothetical protein
VGPAGILPAEENYQPGETPGCPAGKMPVQPIKRIPPDASSFANSWNGLTKRSIGVWAFGGASFIGGESRERRYSHRHVNPEEPAKLLSFP